MDTYARPQQSAARPTGEHVLRSALMHLPLDAHLLQGQILGSYLLVQPSSLGSLQDPGAAVRLCNQT